MLVHIVITADTADRTVRASFDINGEERWRCYQQISRDTLRDLLGFIEKALDAEGEFDKAAGFHKWPVTR